VEVLFGFEDSASDSEESEDSELEELAAFPFTSSFSTAILLLSLSLSEESELVSELESLLSFPLFFGRGAFCFFVTTFFSISSSLSSLSLESSLLLSSSLLLCTSFSFLLVAGWAVSAEEDAAELESLLRSSPEVSVLLEERCEEDVGLSFGAAFLPVVFGCAGLSSLFAEIASVSRKNVNVNEVPGSESDSESESESELSELEEDSTTRTWDEYR
jgi:hypothetical protein